MRYISYASEKLNEILKLQANVIEIKQEGIMMRCFNKFTPLRDAFLPQIFTVPLSVADKTRSEMLVWGYIANFDAI